MYPPEARVGMAAFFTSGRPETYYANDVVWQPQDGNIELPNGVYSARWGTVVWIRTQPNTELDISIRLILGRDSTGLKT